MIVFLHKTPQIATRKMMNKIAERPRTCGQNWVDPSVCFYATRQPASTMTYKITKGNFQQTLESRALQALTQTLRRQKDMTLLVPNAPWWVPPQTSSMANCGWWSCLSRGRFISLCLYILTRRRWSPSENFICKIPTILSIRSHRIFLCPQTNA